MYSSLHLFNSSYVIVENCNIGKYSVFAGLSGTKGSNYATIRNNIIDSDFGVAQYQQYSRSSGIQYGTVQYEGASYWDIHDNYIKWWAMGGFYVGNLAGGKSKYHKFYNNVVTNPAPATYGKGGQLYSGVAGDNSTYCEIYNNYFVNTPMGLQVSSSDNKFYFNIFDNMTRSTSTYSSDGFAFSILQAESPNSPKNNYIFNNTIYNTKDYAFTYDGDITYVFNNLFINCGNNTYSNISTRLGRYTKLTYKNNLFYRSDKNITDRMVFLMEVDGYTITGLNALNGNYNKIIAGNLQYVGPLSNLIISGDFSLPTSSIAKNAGVDISEFVPESFRDRNGTLVNRLAPSIGAIEALDNSSQKLIETRVYLEGAFENGMMNTFLNTASIIPVSQPYNVPPWNYGGTESVQNIPPNIVDWVLVGLKYDTSASTTVMRRAAFLRNDGKVVDLDGTSNLYFNGIGDDYYYLFVSHRNHLGIMSANKIDFTWDYAYYDFTNSHGKCFWK